MFAESWLYHVIRIRAGWRVWQLGWRFTASTPSYTTFITARDHDYLKLFQSMVEIQRMLERICGETEDIHLRYPKILVEKRKYDWEGRFRDLLRWWYITVCFRNLPTTLGVIKNLIKAAYMVLEYAHSWPQGRRQNAAADEPVERFLRLLLAARKPC